MLRIRPYFIAVILIFLATPCLADEESDKMAMEAWTHTLGVLELNAESEYLRPFVDGTAPTAFKEVTLQINGQTRYLGPMNFTLAKEYYEHLRRFFERTSPQRRMELLKILKRTRLGKANSKTTLAALRVPHGYIVANPNSAGKFSSLILLVHEEMHVDQMMREGALWMYFKATYAPWLYERWMESEASLAHHEFIQRLGNSPAERKLLLRTVGKEWMAKKDWQVFESFSEAIQWKETGGLKIELRLTGAYAEEHDKVARVAKNIEGIPKLVLQALAFPTPEAGSEYWITQYPGWKHVTIRAALQTASLPICYYIIRSLQH